MHKINDPRDKRRKLVMLDSIGILGHDCTVWLDHAGSVSVYCSQDAPRSAFWTHNLTINNYRDHMPEWAAHRADVPSAAAILGRKGGSAKSERKALAVRENAKKPRPNRSRIYKIEYFCNNGWLVAHLDFDGIMGEYTNKRKCQQDLTWLKKDNPEYRFRITEY